MLVDPTFNKRDRILGAKEYGEIVLNGINKSPIGILSKNTTFGWTLLGIRKKYKIKVTSMISRINASRERVKKNKNLKNNHKNDREEHTIVKTTAIPV